MRTKKAEFMSGNNDNIVKDAWQEINTKTKLCVGLYHLLLTVVDSYFNKDTHTMSAKFSYFVLRIVIITLKSKE